MPLETRKNKGLAEVDLERRFETTETIHVAEGTLAKIKTDSKNLEVEGEYNDFLDALHRHFNQMENETQLNFVLTLMDYVKEVIIFLTIPISLTVLVITLSLIHKPNCETTAPRQHNDSYEIRTAP